MAFRAAPPFVHLEGVSKGYRSGPSTVCVLDQLDLLLATAKTTSLMGRSGAGKSTLLALIAGLKLPD